MLTAGIVTALPGHVVSPWAYTPPGYAGTVQMCPRADAARPRPAAPSVLWTRVSRLTGCASRGAPRTHLLWLAHSRGLPGGGVDEVIALAGLESAARRKAGGYSLGMRQRLGIAAALPGDPPVLIFDEPSN